MRNSVHLTINIGYWFILIYPFFPLYQFPDLNRKFAFIFFFSLIWIYIGTFTPDLDKKNTRIIPYFSSLNERFKRVFIYPVQEKYDSFGHREITHSLNGFVYISLRYSLLFFLSVLIGLIFQGLWYWYRVMEILFPYFFRSHNNAFDFFFSEYFFPFLIPLVFISFLAYSFAYFGHLWVDTTTLYGICWFYRKEKPKTTGYWKGFIRTGTINTLQGVRVFLIFPLIFMYSEFTLIQSVKLGILQSVFLTLGLTSFFLAGFLLRRERVTKYILKRELCQECSTHMILRMSRKEYGEKVYWKCPSCSKTFDASQELKLLPPDPYFSLSWPNIFFVFLDLLVGLFLLLIRFDLNFLFLSILTLGFSIFIRAWFANRS